MDLNCKQAHELILRWNLERECSFPKSSASRLTACAGGVVGDDSFFWSDLNLWLWWWVSRAPAVAALLASGEMAPEAPGSTEPELSSLLTLPRIWGKGQRAWRLCAMLVGFDLQWLSSWGVPRAPPKVSWASDTLHGKLPLSYL